MILILHLISKIRVIQVQGNTQGIEPVIFAQGHRDFRNLDSCHLQSQESFDAYPQKKRHGGSTRDAGRLCIQACVEKIVQYTMDPGG